MCQLLLLNFLLERFERSQIALIASDCSMRPGIERRVAAIRTSEWAKSASVFISFGDAWASIVASDHQDAFWFVFNIARFLLIFEHWSHLELSSCFKLQVSDTIGTAVICDYTTDVPHRPSTPSNRVETQRSTSMEINYTLWSLTKDRDFCVEF